ncbi:MAG: hypothetical protein GY822_17285 [Deltaproteobacteria bacterium]|nr:hypothetical protein [Deltaproteobacteria bacterium]
MLISPTGCKKAKLQADGGAISVQSQTLDSGVQKKPLLLPAMERVTIPKTRISLLVPTSWKRKRPSTAVLMSREEAEQARDVLLGPQLEQESKKSALRTKRKGKKIRKRSRKEKRRKKRRRKGRKSRRGKKKETKKVTKAPKNIDGLPAALWTSLKLDGRTLFKATAPQEQANQKKTLKAPPPRLVVEQDPWLPMDIDIEDYARAQRRSSLAAGTQPVHVEVETGLREEHPFAILRSVVEMSIAEQAFKLVQQTFLVFVNQEDGGKHGYALMVSFFEANQELMELILKKMWESIRFESD